MKIQGQPPVSSLDARSVQRERDSRAPRSASVGATTDVRVSDGARALGDARAPEQPDDARVERLRGELASGRLVVDADRIADAMLREER